MNKLYTFLFVTVVSFGQAQNVQFVDTVFRNFILNYATIQGYDNGAYPYINIDADSNGVISVAEAKQVYRLTCDGNIAGINSNQKFRDIDGIESFENLEFFDMSAQKTSHVTFNQNPKLKTFISLGGDIVTATFVGLDSLTVLDIDENRISSLILKDLPSLKSVSASSNLLIDLDVSDCDSISELQVKGNPITGVCVPGHSIASVVIDTTDILDTLCGQNVPRNNVVFTDSLFKNWLLNRAGVSALAGNSVVGLNLDPDGDGEVDFEQAEKVYSIFCAGLGTDTSEWFHDVGGIEAFSNMQDLHIDHQFIDSIDLSQNKELRVLFLGGNQLDYLKLSGLNNLEIVSAIDNKITTAEIGNSASLKHIQVGNNQLTDLDVSSLENLESIHCPGNPITHICVSPLVYDSLELTADTTDILDTLCGENIIHIADQNLLNAILSYTPPIDLNGDSILTKSEVLAIDSLNLSGQNISILLGLEAFQNLVSVNISYNQLTFLDISQLQYLTQLIATNNQLNQIITMSGITLTGFRTSEVDSSSLRYIDLSNNDLPYLDVSDQFELAYLDVSGNSNLKTVCVNQDQYDNYAFTWAKDDSTQWSKGSACRVSASVSSTDQEEIKIVNPNPGSVFTSAKLLAVYNVLGIEEKFVQNGNHIDLAHLTDGIYVLMFSEGTTRKILIQK